MFSKCPCCGLDLRERRLASLDAEAREPPQRGALEAIRLGFVNDDAHGEGVTEVDVPSSPTTLRMIAMLPAFRARLKAGVCRALTCHERSSHKRATGSGGEPSRPGLRESGDGPYRSVHASVCEGTQLEIC